MHLGCMQIQCMTASSAQKLCPDGHLDKSIECHYALVLSSQNVTSAYLSHFLEAHAAFVQKEAEVRGIELAIMVGVDLLEQVPQSLGRVHSA